MTTAKSTSGVLAEFATRAFSPVVFERQPQSDAREMRASKFYPCLDWKANVVGYLGAVRRRV
jgi:hypothetical protein